MRASNTAAEINNFMHLLIRPPRQLPKEELETTRVLRWRNVEDHEETIKDRSHTIGIVTQSKSRDWRIKERYKCRESRFKNKGGDIKRSGSYTVGKD